MTSAAALAVFVYGTLKRGQCNHDPFCRGAVAIQPARTLGSLYHLAAGYPALVVADQVVLAAATGSLTLDLELQQQWEQRLAAPAGTGPEKGALERGSVVFGEWMEFSDPATRLRGLDRLENFRPGRRSLYERVLIRTWVGKERVLRAAWTYVQTEPRGTPVPAGNWPA